MALTAAKVLDLPPLVRLLRALNEQRSSLGRVKNHYIRLMGLAYCISIILPDTFYKIIMEIPNLGFFEPHQWHLPESGPIVRGLQISRPCRTVKFW